MIRFAIVIATLCVALSACSQSVSDPEAALREWLASAETAAEEKDRGELMSLISESYMDSRGNDYDQINDILRLYFLRQDSIGLITGIDDVSLIGETAALVRVTVGMAGTRNRVLGINADAYRFELELESHDDEWLLIGARWGELGGQLR